MSNRILIEAVLLRVFEDQSKKVRSNEEIEITQ